ncbi:MAG TPA: inositol monophosphatase [Stellaceae bacterium]|nr:inositol monophosphatase [Stellaceae bacterium]
MLPSIDRVSTLIKDVAKAEILPRFQKLTAGDISEKKPGQLVTTADLESERILTVRLCELLPGSVVVGEEGVAAQPERLALVAGDGAVWVVDPVDGTQNFADGKPVFATMVALLIERSAVASWIYQPVTDRMASAELGSGAFTEGERMHVAAPVALAQMRGRLSGRTAKKLDGKVGAIFNERCAAFDYMEVARGAAHFAVFRRLNPWDHAPGELMVREAGGYARRLDGTPYIASEIDASLLLAPDERSWTALRDLVLEFAP